MKVLGYTDNQTTCEKCGKTNLKGTFIVIDDFNNDYYFGSECVKKTTGESSPNIKEQKQKLKQFILAESHWYAVNSDDYDFHYNKKLEELNLKYKI
jgi:hypothetical protein